MDAAGPAADAKVTAACFCDATVRLDFCRVFDDFDVATVVLRFLNIGDASELRATCKLAKRLTRKFRWNDSSLALTSVAWWRACFPNARSATLVGRSLSGRSYSVPGALPSSAGIVGTGHDDDCGRRHRRANRIVHSSARVGGSDRHRAPGLAEVCITT